MNDSSVHYIDGLWQWLKIVTLALPGNFYQSDLGVINFGLVIKFPKLTDCIKLVEACAVWILISLLKGEAYSCAYWPTADELCPGTNVTYVWV